MDQDQNNSEAQSIPVVAASANTVTPTDSPAEPETESAVDQPTEAETPAQQMADALEEEVVEEASDEADPEPQSSPDHPASFSWQASEFVHHEKAASWYVILGGGTIALSALAVLTRQWFTVIVVLAMGGALAVYAKKEPRVLNYELDDEGIRVENKLYKYDQFRAYAVFNDVAWHSIDLDPAQRFLPRLNVMFDSQNLDTIEAILSEHLPRVERQPDPAEKLARLLKF